MTDSLERFLEDLRFEVPAGLPHRAKAAAAASDSTAFNRLDVNWQRRPWVLTLIAAVLVLAIVATLILAARSIHPKAVVPGGSPPEGLAPTVPIPPSVAANGWIAYSTDGMSSVTYSTAGSDVYLVRAGVAPRLVAGRGGGKIWNVCPAFSPDGRRLAYGVDAAAGRALVVVGMDANGVTTASVRLPIPGPGSIVCPRWSADGKRVAYLESRTVVVRELDGSIDDPAAGDPSVDDFGLAVSGLDGARRFWTEPLLSPKGDRIARLSGGTCKIIVSKPDGSAAHTIFPSTGPGCIYALPTWSPDGRHVLFMVEAGSTVFAMYAIAVDSPFELVTIVGNVDSNGARSMPGWGDVSWQPVLP